MTATQSLRMYEVLSRYFQNPADAKIIIEDLERAIDSKLDQKKEVLATKDDIIRLEQRISDQMKWMIGLFIPLYLSIIGLFVTILLK